MVVYKSSYRNLSIKLYLLRYEENNYVYSIDILPGESAGASV